jgi:hypothetical protein
MSLTSGNDRSPRRRTAFISVDRPTVLDGIARLSEWVSEWILTEQDGAGPRTKAATNEHPKQWHPNISGLVDHRRLGQQVDRDRRTERPLDHADHPHDPGQAISKASTQRILDQIQGQEGWQKLMKHLEGLLMCGAILPAESRGR